MKNLTLKNISELFLDQAAGDLSRSRFHNAANMILLVVTEFDDDVEVIRFLSHHMKDIPLTDFDEFVSELRQEINYLNAELLKTRSQRDKLHRFKEEFSDKIRHGEIGPISTLINKTKYDPKDRPSHVKYLLFKRFEIELDKGEFQNASLITDDFKWLYPDDELGKKRFTDLFIVKAEDLIKENKYNEAILLLIMVLLHDFDSKRGRKLIYDAFQKSSVDAIKYETATYFMKINENLILITLQDKKDRNPLKISLIKLKGECELYDGELISKVSLADNYEIFETYAWMFKQKQMKVAFYTDPSGYIYANFSLSLSISKLPIKIEDKECNEIDFMKMKDKELPYDMEFKKVENI